MLLVRPIDRNLFAIFIQQSGSLAASKNRPNNPGRSLCDRMVTWCGRLAAAVHWHMYCKYHSSEQLFLMTARLRATGMLSGAGSAVTDARPRQSLLECRHDKRLSHSAECLSRVPTTHQIRAALVDSLHGFRDSTELVTDLS